MNSFLGTPVTLHAALGLVGAALVMVLTPGPNMIYLVSRSLSQGRRAGLVSLAGTGVGFVIYMLMASVGLAVVFVVVPWLFIGLKAIGACYLAYLAWQALRPGGAGVFDVRDTLPETAGRLFRMGLVTNLLNPKAAIIYLTLIPQFIDPTRGHEVLQGVTLGALQIAVSLTVNATIVFAGGWIASALQKNPRRVVWQRRVTGTMLAGVAVMLAREVPQRASV